MENNTPSALSAIVLKNGLQSVNSIPNTQFLEMLKDSGISSCNILLKLNQMQLQIQSKPNSNTLSLAKSKSFVSITAIRTQLNKTVAEKLKYRYYMTHGLSKLGRELLHSNMLSFSKSKEALIKLCSERNAHVDPYKFIEQHINRIYKTNKDSYNAKVINDIIYNEDGHIVSVFKDYLIYDDINEFLRRYYCSNEASVRLMKVFNFYDKYSKVFPNYIALPESKFMFKNIEKKQKLLDEMQKGADEKHDIDASIEQEKNIFSHEFIEELNKSNSLEFEEPQQITKDSFLNSYIKNSHIKDVTINGITEKLLTDSISFNEHHTAKAKNGRVKLESIKPSLFTNKMPSNNNFQLSSALFNEGTFNKEKTDSSSFRNIASRKPNLISDPITDSMYSSVRAAKVYNYNPPIDLPSEFISKSNPITNRIPTKAFQLSPFKTNKPNHDSQNPDSHMSGSRISAPSIDQHSTINIKLVHKESDISLKKRYKSNMNIKDIRKAVSKPPIRREEWVSNCPSPKKLGTYTTRNKQQCHTDIRKLNNIDDIAKLYCIGPLIKSKTDSPMLKRQSIDKKALTEIAKNIPLKIMALKASSKTPIPVRVLRASILLYRRQKQ